MAPITASIEIDCPPEKVFDYLSQLDRQGEWQDAVKSIEVLTPGRRLSAPGRGSSEKDPGATRRSPTR